MAATKKKSVSAVLRFREMDEATLSKTLNEMRASLTEARRSLAAQELPSTAAIGKTRKEIAVALTVLGEKRRSAKASVESEEKTPAKAEAKEKA